MLATGDSDFGPVFRRLRELGKGVVGVGPSSVLSKNVSLSCHEFVLTNTNARKRRHGRGGQAAAVAAAAAAGSGAANQHRSLGHSYNSSPPRGTPSSTKFAEQPQALLSSRGGFRIKHQGAVVADTLAAKLDDMHFGAKARAESSASSSVSTPSTEPLEANSPSPLRGKAGASCTAASPSVVSLGASATAVVAARIAATPESTAQQGSVVHQTTPSIEATPVLPPGQLLLPAMVNEATPSSAVAAPFQPVHVPHSAGLAAPAAPASTPPLLLGSGSIARRNNGGGRGDDGVRATNLQPPNKNGPFPRSSDRGCRTSELKAGGLGALSVVRPSEKLYRHLLTLGGAGSAAVGEPVAADARGTSGVGDAGRNGRPAGSDWGSGLSEVSLAKGLVSLAVACGSENSAHVRAVETLEAEAVASSTSVRSRHEHFAAEFGDASGRQDGGANTSVSAGFSREEACSVAGLLQRCGFLTWMSAEQQWVVTVPADVEVLRRCRDEVMMEELRARCQEAGVPFEPSLAANLRWAKRSS